MALHESPQGLRWIAVNELRSEKADHIVHLLDKPTEVSWAAHSLLLGNLAEAGITPRRLTDFLDVDDLYIASACAKLTTMD